MIQNYTKMFTDFLKKRSVSNTYKFVLLLALLDLGELKTGKITIPGHKYIEQKDDKLFVGLHFVAIRVVHFYWLVDKYHLKQGSTENNKIIQLVTKETLQNKTNIPDKKSLADNTCFEQLLLSVVKVLRDMPCKKLLNDMPNFYKIVNLRLEFDKDVIEFMYTNKLILKKAINNELTKYLESRNIKTPNIAHKIESERIKRTILSKKDQNYLFKKQHGKCFYCDVTIEYKNNTRNFDDDHVIPWAFVFGTKIHNMVLACKKCNSAKSDKLPCEYIFERVLNRNEEIKEEIKEEGYSKDVYQRGFDDCKMDYVRSHDTCFDPTLSEPTHR